MCHFLFNKVHLVALLLLTQAPTSIRARATWILNLVLCLLHPNPIIDHELLPDLKLPKLSFCLLVADSLSVSQLFSPQALGLWTLISPTKLVFLPLSPLVPIFFLLSLAQILSSGLFCSSWL